MPMISVIIPVYKVEDYLNECMDSVLSQTYTDFEVICIDDGSPDDCPRILDEYARQDSRVKIIHQENQGLSAARNTGLDNAKGEWIAFIDSDDKIAPTYLEKLASHTNNVDCVEVGLKYFRNESDLLNLDAPSEWFDKYLFNKPGLFAIKPSIFKYCAIGCWNKLYKRDIIEKYNLRFIKGLLFEDNYFTFAYLSHCKNIFEVGEKLYFYRNRQTSISNTKRNYEHYFDEMKNFIALAEHFEKFGLIKKFRLALLYLFIHNSFCESRLLCDREITTNLITKMATLISVDINKFLKAVEPKSFIVKVFDKTNAENKLKVIEHSENVSRKYGKNELTIDSMPQDFLFTFIVEKPAMLQIFFGVRNFLISSRNTETDNTFLVKEICINGKTVGENIVLNKSHTPSIMVRANANTKTIINVKI